MQDETDEARADRLREAELSIAQDEPVPAEADVDTIDDAEDEGITELPYRAKNEILPGVTNDDEHADATLEVQIDTRDALDAIHDRLCDTNEILTRIATAFERSNAIAERK